MTRIVCAGEVMVEFSQLPHSNNWSQALGGDTFNTAIYLAREGLTVSYQTMVGDDDFSKQALNCLRQEDIRRELVTQKHNTALGLYTIHNDIAGERYFSYWRSSSPARQLFDKPVTPPDCDIFFFSGITLAITRNGFAHFLTFLNSMRERKVKIIFDPNFREKLWDTVDQAQKLYRQIFPYCHTVLPTLDDEVQLWGVADVTACQKMYANFDIKEVVIKSPTLVCDVFAGDVHIQQQAVPVKAIDTTGAGDAFAAAYIAARSKGGSIKTAITHAQNLAAKVVQHQGAVLPSSINENVR